MKDYYPKLSITEYVKRYGSPNETINKSYSHKPHLAELPHDRRTNDPDKLQERIDAIDERLEQHELEAYYVEREDMQLQQDKERIEKDIKGIEKDITDIEKDIKKETENIETNKKDFGQSMLDEYALWKDYMKGIEMGDDNIIGIDTEEGLYWSDNHRKAVIKEAEELDRRVEDIMSIDYDKATNKDYEELERLGSNITNFMKDNYDHETFALEMNVWFKYGDTFNETPQYLQNAFDSKNKINSYEKDIEKLQTEIASKNNELGKINEDIEQNNKRIRQLETEGIDYVEEKKKCEAKMKEIKKD